MSICNEYTTAEVDFEIARDVWAHELWANIADKIKPMSSLISPTQIDMSIYKKYQPKFWAVYFDTNIVGINSGHQTSEISYRSRGLWVSSDHRGRGIEKKLLMSVLEESMHYNCEYCWSMPRFDASGAYTSVGFVQQGGWFETDTSDKNCYAICSL